MLLFLLGFASGTALALFILIILAVAVNARQEKMKARRAKEGGPHMSADLYRELNGFSEGRN